MSRAHHSVLVAALGCAALASVAGCSNSPLPTPEVAVSSTLSPDGGGCNLPSAFVWSVGTVGSSRTYVSDGQSQNGDSVSPQCQVAASYQGGFEVTATVTLDQVGTLSLQGSVTDTPGGVSLISGTFTDSAGIGAYTEIDCGVTFAGPGQYIAPGEIYAHLSCPVAASVSQSYTCDGEADFAFKDCDR